MRKIVLCCMAILCLFSTACSRRTMGEAGKLNVLCYSFQERELLDAYWTARIDDDTIPELFFITPSEDFSDVMELYDMLLTSLLTKSPDVDLYCMSSYEENMPTILRNQYYVDLSEYDTLTGYFDDMYPEIKDWCTEGDALFGFPFYVNYTMHIMVNPDLMDTIGYSVDDIRTVDGLVDFCDTWEKEKTSPPNGGRPIAPTLYFGNYLLQHYDRDTGELDLDTPEFRATLTQCRDMLAYEDLFQRSFTAITDVDSDTSPLYFDCASILSRNPQYQPMPYPLLEAEAEDTKRYTEVWWLIANPYGKHVDQVVACLSALAKSMGQTQLHTPIYRDADYYSYKDLYTQDRLDTTGEMISHMSVGTAFPRFNTIMSLCDEYVYEDTKTLDQVIEEAQHITDMMQREQFLDQ